MSLLDLEMLQNHSDSSEEIAADSHNGDVDLDESQLKGKRQETSQQYIQTVSGIVMVQTGIIIKQYWEVSN